MSQLLGFVPIEDALGAVELAGHVIGVVVDLPGCAPQRLVGAEVPTATPGGDITYMVSTDTYLYEWKTSKGWTGCRRLIVTLDDGTRHHADFQFK